MSTETEFAREACALLDHEAVISADADMAIVRMFNFGEPKRYVGLKPEAALRLGAALIRAGLRVNPTLNLQLLESAARGDVRLQAVPTPEGGG
jgi:hypothetical protein